MPPIQRAPPAPPRPPTSPLLALMNSAPGLHRRERRLVDQVGRRRPWRPPGTRRCPPAPAGVSQVNTRHPLHRPHRGPPPTIHRLHRLQQPHQPAPDPPIPDHAHRAAGDLPPHPHRRLPPGPILRHRARNRTAQIDHHAHDQLGTTAGTEARRSLRHQHARRWTPPRHIDRPDIDRVAHEGDQRRAAIGTSTPAPGTARSATITRHPEAARTNASPESGPPSFRRTAPSACSAASARGP